jgi:hypothetical protein
MRLAKIRAHLVKFQALGIDTSTWESEFLLNLIDELLKGVHSHGA